MGINRLILIAMLALSLKADVCWNTDIKEYINYLWLEDEMVTDYQNAVDDRLVAIFVYPVAGLDINTLEYRTDSIMYCEYTKEFK